VLGGDEVTFAAFSFLFNFRVVQVDRWGQPVESTCKMIFWRQIIFWLNQSAIVTWVVLLPPQSLREKPIFPILELGLTGQSTQSSSGTMAIFRLVVISFSNVPEWNYRNAFRTLVTC
jgi:hypothetical protein